MKQPMLDCEQTNNKVGHQLLPPEFLYAVDNCVSNCVNRLLGVGRPAALNGHELENSVRVTGELMHNESSHQTNEGLGHHDMIGVAMDRLLKALDPGTISRRICRELFQSPNVIFQRVDSSRDGTFHYIIKPRV